MAIYTLSPDCMHYFTKYIRLLLHRCLFLRHQPSMELNYVAFVDHHMCYLYGKLSLHILLLS